MKSTLKKTILAAILACTLNSSVRAGIVTWDYEVTTTTPTVTSGLSTLEFLPTKGSAETLTDLATKLVIAKVKLTSTADPNSPDTFSSALYSFDLKLTDSTGAWDTMTFSGLLSGTASSMNALVNVNAFTGLTTQSKPIGAHTYTVTIKQYNPPGRPSTATDTSLGGFGVEVVVSGDGGATPASVPEPSALLLAGLGVGAAVFARRRRR